MGNGRFRRKESNFTQISNNALSDTDLNTRTLGLYCRISYYLSIPDWDLYKNHLLKTCPEGKKAFESMWDDLKKSGYLVQYKMRSEKGSFYYEYELLNEINHIPQKEVLVSRVPENSGTGYSGTAKKGVYNKTKIINTLQSNTITHTNLKTLCEKIQNTLSEKITQKKIKELISTAGIETIKHYMNTWDKYRPFAKQGQAAYFIYCIQHQVPVPQQAKSNNPKYADFVQREYGDDFYEQFIQK